MSTIAVKIEDGYVTMVGDRQVNHDGWGSHALTKVYRIGDDLVGMVGEMGKGSRAVRWYREGADPLVYPKEELSGGNFILLVWDGTNLLTIDDQGFPVIIEETVSAVGSGAMAARGAMAMGASAARAIEIASMVDSSTGMGQDIVRIQQ